MTDVESAHDVTYISEMFGLVNSLESGRQRYLFMNRRMTWTERRKLHRRN